METVTEVWRSTPRFPNYEASSAGRVRSVDRDVIVARNATTYTIKLRGRVMKECVGSGGYKVVTLCMNGKQRFIGVHQLVADAFHGPAEGMTVNHINGRKTDNQPENLEYLNRRDNTLHAHRTGLIDGRGEGNGRAKLLSSQVDEIRNFRGRMAAPDVARKFGIARTTVHAIWNQKTWNSPTGA